MLKTSCGIERRCIRPRAVLFGNPFGKRGSGIIADAPAPNGGPPDNSKEMMEVGNMDHSMRLLFLPTRRNMEGEFFCNIDVALNRKKIVRDKLDQLGIDYVDIDFLNDEGLLFNGMDADRVAEYAREKHVDAVFAPHVNFGSEDAVAKVAKRLDKPLLLWGPRDDAPDAMGHRCTDSQCGLFATGKVLRQHKVPFTYMTNCTVDDPTFERTLRQFLAVAQVVKALRNLRLGQISVRPEPFWSVKSNELQLLERFGIEVVPTTLIELQAIFQDTLKNENKILDDMIASYRSRYAIHVEEDRLRNSAALTRSIRRWADEMKLDAIASACWGPMRELGNVASCFSFSELTEEKLPVICENDIHGAITSVIAQAATRWTCPSFFADLTIRHPENDNAELFWHCGVFPSSLGREDQRSSVEPNFDEKRPCVAHFELKKGDVTLCRFDCSEDQYSLLMMEGKVIDGPITEGTYGWIEFKDWPKIEHKFVTGPYIHHCVGVYGHIAEILYEACKYIPGLKPDFTEPTEEELAARLR